MAEGTGSKLLKPIPLWAQELHLKANNYLMADNTIDKNSGAGKPERIYLYEAYQVMYWAKKFGITVDKLKKAVKSAGHRVSDVEQYLRNEHDFDQTT